MQVAGRYTLGDFLGDGGFSEVFRAWDDVLQRSVAVKLVWAATGKRPLVSRERFLSEARSAARVSHPNVVAIHDVGEHPSEHGPVPYLVMAELGHAFSRDLAVGPVRPGDACRVMADVCAGLAAVHAAGIVHRDVKPANILLDDAGDGRAVLTDFGIAQALDAAAHPDGPRTGGTLQHAGTPPYLSPERVRGGRAEPASDVWAVGVVLYEALTGQQPFADPEAIVAGTYRPLVEVAPPLPMLPPTLVETVNACLAAEPGHRPTATALVAVLRRQADLLAGVVPGAAVGPAPVPVPVSVPPPTPAPAPARWYVTVEVDRAWHARQELEQDRTLPNPPALPAYTVTLDPAGVLVGRPSASLGSRPALDLSSDIGISRRHCLLVAEGSGGALTWSVEDLSSSNGTYLAPATAGTTLPTAALPPGVKQPLAAGDRIYLGVWTRLTVVTG